MTTTGTCLLVSYLVSAPLQTQGFRCFALASGRPGDVGGIATSLELRSFSGRPGRVLSVCLFDYFCYFVFLFFPSFRCRFCDRGAHGASMSPPNCGTAESIVNRWTWKGEIKPKTNKGRQIVSSLES